MLEWDRQGSAAELYPQQALLLQELPLLRTGEPAVPVGQQRLGVLLPEVGDEGDEDRRHVAERVERGLVWHLVQLPVAAGCYLMVIGVEHEVVEHARGHAAVAVPRVPVLDARTGDAH